MLLQNVTISHAIWCIRQTRVNELTSYWKIMPFGIRLENFFEMRSNCSRGLSYEFLSPEISNKFTFTCDSTMFPFVSLTFKSSSTLTHKKILNIFHINATRHKISMTVSYHSSTHKKISPSNNRKSIIYSIDFHFCLIKALFVPLIWSWVDSIHKLWCYCQQVHIDYLLHGARRGLLN